MYQYSGRAGSSHVVMHLSIDSVPQKYSKSITGNTALVGDSGIWQGSLNSGAHKVSLNYCTPVKTDNTVSSDLEWKCRNK